MKIKDFIDRWAKKGIVDESQAKEMRKDVEAYNDEHASNRIIKAISIIGAILIGLGTIIFLRALWDDLGDYVKIFIPFSFATFFYIVGFYLREVYQGLQKVSTTLLFIASAVYGITLFVVANVYELPMEYDAWISLLWLIGVIPMVYLLRSRLLSVGGYALASLTIWAFATVNWEEHFEYMLFTVLVIAVAAFFYLLAELQSQFNKKWDKISIVYKWCSGLIISGVLFTYTYIDFLKESLSPGIDGAFSKYAVMGVLVLIFGALIVRRLKGVVVNIKEPNFLKLLIVIGVGVIALLMNFTVTISPVKEGLFDDNYIFYFLLVLFINIIYVFLNLIVIYLGYKEDDKVIVNLGFISVFVFIIGKYISIFQDLVNEYLFFLMLGLVFILAAGLLEYQRRNLKSIFNED